jgi:hypothetical protein
MKTLGSDIDIDVANRDAALSLIKHIPASQWRDEQLVKHNTGIYVTAVPCDNLKSVCSFDYETAEAAGYVKIDIINNGVYQLVRDPQHLTQLLAIPPCWQRLNNKQFFSQIVHIGNHWDLYRRLREPLDSIPKMAMFLALIRPAKRHLANNTWSEMAKTIWVKPTDGTYGWKKSHGLSYAILVSLHMTICDQIEQGVL